MRIIIRVDPKAGRLRGEAVAVKITVSYPRLAARAGPFVIHFREEKELGAEVDYLESRLQFILRRVGV